MQKWSLGARLPIALGLAAALSAAAPAAAQVPPVTTCNGGTLAPGTGGDLEVTGSDCWSTTFVRTYYADSLEWAPTEGDPASCVFADQDLPE